MLPCFGADDPVRRKAVIDLVEQHEGQRLDAEAAVNATPAPG